MNKKTLVVILAAVLTVTVGFTAYTQHKTTIQSSTFIQSILNPGPTPANLENSKILIDTVLLESRIVTITKSTCPYCRKAKALLFSLRATTVAASNVTDIVLNQMNGRKASAIQAHLTHRTGQKTVPYIFIDGMFIGGFDSLRTLHISGNLVTLLQ
ncbi:hypothetical protein HK100_002596 [Physocladia obscura]|uniref:Glutaredoxin domain-containing protein n=1 Tax=Physocladia obscura TaxID=109957 RepID=A0AAD5XE48_9FUNG|nr:hypothetical protein HK100_002596 [Physocladia obscura]